MKQQKLKVKILIPLIAAAVTAAAFLRYVFVKPEAGDGYLAARMAQRSELCCIALGCLFVCAVFYFACSLAKSFLYSGLSPKIANTKAAITALVLTAAAILLCLPYLNGILTKGHDTLYHLERIEGLSRGMLAGYFPVRVQPMWVNSHGYAVSLYYPDLFLYFPAVLRSLGIGLTSAYIIFVITLNAVTVFIAYKSFERIFKSSSASVCGAVLYSFCMYRFSCVYVRASVGEYTAMLFMPLILAGLYGIFTDITESAGYKYVWVVPALGFAGLLYSHLLTAAVCGLFTLLICIIFIKRTLNKKRFFALVKTAAFAVLLSAAFIIPFADAMRADVAIKSQSAFSIVTSEATRLFELFPKMICDPTGTEAIDLAATVRFAPGLALIVGAVMFIFSYILSLKHSERDIKALRSFGLFCLISGVVLFAVTTEIFSFKYFTSPDTLLGKLCGMLQFSWRLSGIASLMLSSCAAAGVSLLGALYPQKWSARFWSGAVCLAAAALSLTVWSVSFDKSNKKLDYMADGAVLSQVVLEMFYCPSACGYELFDYASFSSSQNVTLSDAQRGELTASFYAVNDSDSAGYVDVPLIYYDCYKAYLDTGDETAEITESENGTLRVVVPSGQAGTIKVEYHAKPLWRVSEAVSFLAFAFFIGIMIYKRKKYGYDKLDSTVPQ